MRSIERSLDLGSIGRSLDLRSIERLLELGSRERSSKMGSLERVCFNLSDLIRVASLDRDNLVSFYYIS